jgi:hypothetical protein
MSLSSHAAINFSRRPLADGTSVAQAGAASQGAAFPAFLHFGQTNRPARSCTHVVGTWRSAQRPTSRGVWQREHLISSHGQALNGIASNRRASSETLAWLYPFELIVTCLIIALRT